MTAELPTGPCAECDLRDRGGNVRGRGHFRGGSNVRAITSEAVPVPFVVISRLFVLSKLRGVNVSSFRRDVDEGLNESSSGTDLIDEDECGFFEDKYD